MYIGGPERVDPPSESSHDALMHNNDENIIMLMHASLKTAPNFAHGVVCDARWPYHFYFPGCDCRVMRHY